MNRPTANNYTSIPSSQDGNNNKGKAPKWRTSKKFPGKLHTMMEYVEYNGLEHIISWALNGCGIKINDPNELITILPLFFGQTKYRSFRRQLNLWHFTRIVEGPNEGVFVHPYFVKEQKHLCAKMNREVPPPKSSLAIVGKESEKKNDVICAHKPQAVNSTTKRVVSYSSATEGIVNTQIDLSGFRPPSPRRVSLDEDSIEIDSSFYLQFVHEDDFGFDENIFDDSNASSSHLQATPSRGPCAPTNDSSPIIVQGDEEAALFGSRFYPVGGEDSVAPSQNDDSHDLLHMLPQDFDDLINEQPLVDKDELQRISNHNLQNLTTAVRSVLSSLLARKQLLLDHKDQRQSSRSCTCDCSSSSHQGHFKDGMVCQALPLRTVPTLNSLLSSTETMGTLFEV